MLGATGQVGSVAVQAAKLLGAGRVIAAARGGERLDRMRERGADAVVDVDGDGDLTERIREAAGGEVDVTIDSLWGEPAVAAMGAAARFGRHVQVGQLAGPSLDLSAPAIRSKSLDVRGFMGLHPRHEIRAEAYTRLGEHVARGEIVIDLERIPLADVASAWERQRTRRGREAGPHPERRHMSSVVLRGGTVLTMNDAHDILHGADVLVVDDKIAGIGPGPRGAGGRRRRSTPPTASSCRA